MKEYKSHSCCFEQGENPACGIKGIHRCCLCQAPVPTPHQEIRDWEEESIIRFRQLWGNITKDNQHLTTEKIEDLIRAEIKVAFLAGQKAMVEQIKKKYGEDFTMEVSCGTENMLPAFRVIDLNEALQTLEDNLNK